MKTIFVRSIQAFLLALVLTSTANVHAQNDRFLYVYPSESDAYPVDNAVGSNQTNNAQINQLFENYSVTSYSQSFPGAAATASISNAYEIYLEGNIENFATSLWATGKFSCIQDYYFDELATCPIDVNDPIVASQTDVQGTWHLESIDAFCAWEITTGDPGITIGIADIEFDESHSDLQQNLIFVEDEVDIVPECQHGTSVAGAASADTNNATGMAGVGYNTTIAGYTTPHFALYDDEGIFRGCAGSPWRAMWRAFLDGRPVINLSWSGIGFGTINLPDGTPINTQKDAAEYITQNGSVLVVSGGNSLNSPNNHSAISDVPGVINVAWLNFGEVLSSNRPYNQFNDLVAPASLRSLRVGNSTAIVAGTSFSAPIVSGTVALVMSVDDCATVPEIEGIIKSTTEAVSNGDTAPHGTGKLNTNNAVRMAAGYTTFVDRDRTWNDPLHLSGDVVVTDGVELTITSQVRIAQGVKIIVEPNARLILDGAILTNDCAGEKWDGIVVTGNSAESQDYNLFSQRREQGYLRMRNDATIANATYGVRLYNPSDGVITDHGGIISASNSNFINCTYSVDFAPYQNFDFFSGNPKGNASRFSLCNFIVDDEMNESPLGFRSHISMRSITGLRITGCTFANDRDFASSADIEERGAGVKSLDSEFKITALCNQPTPGSSCEELTLSEFRGFNNAVLSGNKGGINTFTVDRAVFIDNHFGVAGYSSDQCRITRSDFSIGTELPTVTNPYVGVLLSGATGFRVEDNTFSVSSTLDPVSEDAIGTVIRNSGNQINEVYNNTYEGLTFANVSNGDNRGTSAPNAGLSYFCNENNDNAYDFAVPIIFDADGVAMQQGNSSLSAGNTFTESPLFATSHFFNQASNISYFYSNGNDEMPTNTSGNVFPQFTISSNSCFSSFPDGDSEGLTQEDREELENILQDSPNIEETVEALNILVKDTKHDAENLNFNQIRQYLDEYGDYRSLQAIVDSYIQERLPLDAILALGEIPVKIALDGEKLEDYLRFVQLKNIQIAAISDNISDEILLSDYGTILEELADNRYGPAASQAYYFIQDAVSKQTGAFVHNPIELPATDVIERSEKNSETEGLTFSVFPNPVHSFTNFTYDLSEKVEVTTLTVIDMNGREVKNVDLNKLSKNYRWDTSGVTAGVYIYNITSGGTILHNGKIIIVK